MTNEKKFMKELLDLYTPSGSENDSEYPRELLSNYLNLTESKFADRKNQVYGLGQENGTRVLISGHIDEICMVVGDITKEGYLIPYNMGGFDKKTLPGLSVAILSSTSEIYEGIVQTNPIHVWAREKDADRAFDFHEVRIDVGCGSKEDVEERGIRVGDMICPLHKNNVEFGVNKVFGNSLDDKAGVWIMAQVLRECRDNCSLNSIYLLGAACSGEETGLRGARTVAKNVNPDISIDIDVAPASDNGLLPTPKYPAIELGKGPVIVYGPDKDRELNLQLEEVAKDLGVEFQRSVARAGGTNTDILETFASNCKATLISIPCLSLHTPSETCDWRDIEGAVKIIVGWVKKFC